MIALRNWSATRKHAATSIAARSNPAARRAACDRSCSPCLNGPGLLTSNLAPLRRGLWKSYLIVSEILNQSPWGVSIVMEARRVAAAFGDIAAAILAMKLTILSLNKKPGRAEIEAVAKYRIRHGRRAPGSWATKRLRKKRRAALSGGRRELSGFMVEDEFTRHVGWDFGPGESHAVVHLADVRSD